MSVVVPSYEQAIAFNPSRFNVVPLAQSDRVRVMLVCMEAGQFIPIHHPAVDVTLLVLQGEGLVAAGDLQTSVGPGAVVYAKAGEARGLKAQSRLVALHVVAPPPTEADHAEVMAGLAHGAWQ